MEALLRFLNRPVSLRPAGPRARSALWLLLVGWLLLNAADWTTTTALLIRGGSHEDNPLRAALLAHGGVAALAGYKVLVIAGGVVVTGLGFRLWPRVFIVLIAGCGLRRCLGGGR